MFSMWQLLRAVDEAFVKLLASARYLANNQHHPPIRKETTTSRAVRCTVRTRKPRKTGASLSGHGVVTPRPTYTTTRWLAATRLAMLVALIGLAAWFTSISPNISSMDVQNLGNKRIHACTHTHACRNSTRTFSLESLNHHRKCVMPKRRRCC